VRPTAVHDRVTLSEDERLRFARDGFVALDHPVVGPGDVVEARALLEPLFARFAELPPEYAWDLGDVKYHEGPQETPEINRTIELEPRLSRTVAFRRCRQLAAEMLGGRARYVYDHAICKPPNNDTTIEWHQDLAYSPQSEPGTQVHIWLALQDVAEENGCMRFLPGVGALLPHSRRGHSDLSHALVAEGIDPSAAVKVPRSAGMATVHRLTTPHSSGPNRTDQPRLAWILQFHTVAPRARMRAALSALTHHH
jgi:hypothetical protein